MSLKMIWHEFYHPDISWPVVRRHIGREFLELLRLASQFSSRGGWAVLNRSCYPSENAYRSAKSRLLKQGLIATRSMNGRSPNLILTDEAEVSMPDYFAPELKWNLPWNKRWYMLIYDVPETDRKYRNILRRFLKKKHLGLLQQSVWVTPKDIRPDFNDLVQAANIDAFAYLFESRTVLGLPSHTIVENAWDFDALHDRQEHFCQVTDRNIAELQSGEHPPHELGQLLRMTLAAYHSAMSEDPLLPEALLPETYLGKTAYRSFRKLLNEIDKQTHTLQQH